MQLWIDENMLEDDMGECVIIDQDKICNDYLEFRVVELRDVWKLLWSQLSFFSYPAILHPYPNEFLSMQGGCFADQLKE